MLAIKPATQSCPLVRSGSRNEFMHVLSHQSPDDIEAAPNELIRQLKGNGLAVRTILAEKLFLDRLFRGFGNEGVTETGTTLECSSRKETVSVSIRVQADLSMPQSMV